MPAGPLPGQATSTCPRHCWSFAIVWVPSAHPWPVQPLAAVTRSRHLGQAQEIRKSPGTVRHSAWACCQFWAIRGRHPVSCGGTNIRRDLRQIGPSDRPTGRPQTPGRSVHFQRRAAGIGLPVHVMECPGHISSEYPGGDGGVETARAALIARFFCITVAATTAYLLDELKPPTPLEIRRSLARWRLSRNLCWMGGPEATDQPFANEGLGAGGDPGSGRAVTRGVFPTTR